MKKNIIQSILVFPLSSLMLVVFGFIVFQARFEGLFVVSTLVIRK